jgi:hypothetical protein
MFLNDEAATPDLLEALVFTDQQERGSAVFKGESHSMTAAQPDLPFLLLILPCAFALLEVSAGRVVPGLHFLYQYGEFAFHRVRQLLVGAIETPGSHEASDDGAWLANRWLLRGCQLVRGLLFLLPRRSHRG